MERTNTGKPISATQETILVDIFNFGNFMTVDQVQRLHFSQTSRNYVGELLRDLEKREYITHTFLSRASQAGKSPSVYTLLQKGFKHISDMGIEVPPRARPSEIADLTPFFLEHTLLVNDVLIAAHLLEKVAPQYKLLSFMHDNTLKKEPVLVQVNGKPFGVILDSWMKFQLPSPDATIPDTQAIGFEIDRGTRDAKSFKEQLRLRLAFIRGPYQERFHTQNITLAFAAKLKTPEKTKERVSAMYTWCEDVLKEDNSQDDSFSFFFGGLPDGVIDPLWLFLRPAWVTPFDTSAQTLLDVQL